MKPEAARAVTLKRRCAVYTRKSSEEGLDQAFSSLDAQREACEAYVLSQKSEGWLLLSDRYDDGGCSGGTLDRPALQRLIRDMEAGAIDVVVVYKIDRLSRSLMDFSRLVDVFERHNVTFVSVTQHFSTSTSMGRLTLNMLLSFAQFEREIAGERIRDKIAASRKKGMWMGGNPPLGYDVKDRKLVVNEEEAKLVRLVFERFESLASATLLCRELEAKGYRAKTWTTHSGRIQGNRPISKTTLYKILQNRTDLGEAVHKGASYPGQHAALIDSNTWEKVHAILRGNTRTHSNRARAKTDALLKGLIFAPSGRAMTPSHTRRGGKLYRYYVTTDVIKRGPDSCPIKRVPAAEVERAVIDQIRNVLRAPEVVVRTWQQVRKQDPASTERQVRDALHRFDPLWNELFPAEQTRIIRLLVERVEVALDQLTLRLRVEGLTSLVSDLDDKCALGDERGLHKHSQLVNAGSTAGGSTLTITIAINLQQRGGRKLVVTPPGILPWAPTPPRIDNTLMRAVARAYRWKRMIEGGEYATIRDIERHEGVTNSFVSRVLKLTLLAPDIVEAILDGRQSTAMQLEDIAYGISAYWPDQRKYLSNAIR